MNREERLQRLKKAKEETNKLWNNGISDLSLSQNEINILKKEFEIFSTHFQMCLLKDGFSSIIDKYEKIIYGIENSICEHNGEIRKGKDYQNCCGISYKDILDLHCRDAIEIIRNNIKEQQFNLFRNRIEKLDERFKKVPKRSGWIVNEKGVEKYKKLNYWWYLGLPLTVLE